MMKTYHKQSARSPSDPGHPGGPGAAGEEYLRASNSTQGL